MSKKNLLCEVLKKKTFIIHYLPIMRSVVILLFASAFISVAKAGSNGNIKVKEVTQQGKTITGRVTETNGNQYQG